MREPIEKAVGTEQPFGDITKLPMRPTVTINGTRDITGSFIAAAANMLDRANAAVAYISVGNPTLAFIFNRFDKR